MQFVWQHRLGVDTNTLTADGRRVRIIDQGRLNTDAGPDFFNASVQIGDETWAGNVEIHSYGNVKTAVAMLCGLCREDLCDSDFVKEDPDYPVILSVVLKKK